MLCSIKFHNKSIILFTRWRGRYIRQSASVSQCSTSTPPGTTNPDRNPQLLTAPPAGPLRNKRPKAAQSSIRLLAEAASRQPRSERGDVLFEELVSASRERGTYGSSSDSRRSEPVTAHDIRVSMVKSGLTKMLLLATMTNAPGNIFCSMLFDAWRVRATLCYGEFAGLD